MLYRHAAMTPEILTRIARAKVPRRTIAVTEVGRQPAAPPHQHVVFPLIACVQMMTDPSTNAPKKNGSPGASPTYLEFIVYPYL